ncbi:MAG TPA: SpoIIE family protein phosphatase [Bryobacteraceae bacterium]|nr:SpoIIE family protein phosphatase [Bryobacteraceae bacterium]
MVPEVVSAIAGPASLVVVDPNGHRTRVEIKPVPFKIGRQADSQLVLRDSRASRNHAQILLENGQYVIEDSGSRHGIYVNGTRVERQILRNSDRIEFGVSDSYQLIFALDGAELKRLMEQLPAQEPAVKTGAGTSLAKLRAVLEVARTLQTGFSTQEVLNAVVDAALTVTGAERGFLLLRREDDLEVRVARDNRGRPLAESDLRVPRRVMQRALEQRRELLSMNFDTQAGEASSEHSVADLDLRSVVCLPLVRISGGGGQATSVLSTHNDTVGVLYMDSRSLAADLSGGNRELLQTLAIEASTILENARLLAEERRKEKIEEELSVARAIQQSLLPRRLPSEGWFRAWGSSMASHQVGGDYFDVIAVSESCWATVVTDVSGKGVSSALLASLLQGAFLTASEGSAAMSDKVAHINRFLYDRTDGGKYATIFYCLLDRAGRLRYINAGHCAPILLSRDGRYEYLETTAMPAGLLPQTEFPVEERQISPGDRLVIYSDGVTEAENLRHQFFGSKQLREIAVAHAHDNGAALHDAVLAAVKAFVDSAEQADDITLVVVEYRPD